MPAVAYHFNEGFDTKQDVYLSRLAVFWVSESKTFQVLPILIEGDCAHRLVTSDLWYNDCIDVVSQARGVCRQDEELCHILSLCHCVILPAMPRILAS